MLKFEKLSQQMIIRTLELSNDTAGKRIICIHKKTLSSIWI